MKNQLPSPQELATLFWYDIDGQLTRRVDAGRWGREKAGTVVGTPHREGYLSVMVHGKRLLVHRVCFAIAHGQWPEGQIDHIDGNRTNNRLSNLRDVLPGENSQNRHRTRSDSSTGMLGIRPMRKRWQANIRVDGKRVCLGTFDTPEQAQGAYMAAKQKLHPFSSAA